MLSENEILLCIRVNHSYTISLPANKTTGFSWEIAQRDPRIKCTELKYQRHVGGIGAGGFQKFELTGSQPGEYEIRFLLKRAWESTIKDVRVYHISVTKNDDDDH